jgi:Na+-translocating ferredoxin:NAD+ oxidoreductase RnfE subunit
MQKIIFMTLLACSSSAFAGNSIATPVLAPGTFVLLGLGVAAALYIAKKRKK